MLRVLRIVGVVVFAVLVAFSAHRLRQLYQEGKLFDPYSSERKANVTLLGTSMLALGALGYFELTRERRRMSGRRGYAPVLREQEEILPDTAKTSSIYSAPKTMGAWEGRRSHSSRSRHKHRLDPTALWIGLLEICCVVLLVAYMGLLVFRLVVGVADSTTFMWLTGALSVMTVLSAVTVAGVLLRKVWGLTFGYLLAICNLLLFPLGTAAGLVMLMGLVGATPLFILPARDRRREARNRAQKKEKIAVS